MKTLAPFTPAFIYGLVVPPVLGSSPQGPVILIVLAWVALAAGLYISDSIYKWEEPAREAAECMRTARLDGYRAYRMEMEKAEADKKAKAKYQKTWEMEKAGKI